MQPFRITNKVARQLWLTSQGLGTAPTGPLELLALIKSLGFVQLDTIQVVSRAHHHILWSRNQNYKEAMLDKLLSEKRSIFEHFTHDASVIPMDFLPMWQRQFRRKKERMDRPGYFKNPPTKKLLKQIKSRIDKEGPLSTHAFESKIEGPKEMWSRPSHKVALDYLWYIGELATSHRVNFTKYYDLAERVFPADLKVQSLTDQQQIDWLCNAALERMGFGTQGEIQKFWEAMDAAEVKGWLLHSRDQLQEVEIETHDRQWIKAYALKGIEERLSVLKPVTSRLRILNPFDPVIRDRNRLERLFGFEYRVEMFVPADKRQWGYYVYPILEGDRFVGRIEVKADRKDSCLSVLNFWQEVKVKWPDARMAKLEAELERMRRFVGVEKIIWDK